jgi:lactoylglutathione lyase
VFREPFPILYVEDVERSAAFYRDCFGFEIGYRPGDGEGLLQYAFLRLPPLGIGLATAAAGERGHGRQASPSGPARLELCIYCDDTDPAAQRLRAAGAPELRAPQDESGGERRAYFADPAGNSIQITAPIVRAMASPQRSPGSSARRRRRSRS